MKKSILFIFSLCFCFSSFSQEYIDPEAKAILDKVSLAIQKSTGDRAEFTLIVDNAQTENKQTMEGVICLKGNKFKLSISEVETYFDGQTQWVYMLSSDEVTISTPTEEELQDINPTNIISSYKKGYKIKKDDDSVVNGKPVYVVDLYPDDRTKEFFRISLAIEKTTSNIVSVSTYGKNGTTTTVKIKKYQKNMNFLDSIFVFDKKKYPEVEVIDLR